MFKHIFSLFVKEASGLYVQRHVYEIAKYHRIQSSPGFREAAGYCLQAFREFGFKGASEVLTFPGDGRTRFWGCLMPQEWAVDFAELKIVKPDEASTVLASYRDVKTSLIQRSFPTPPGGVEADVVLVEEGENEEDYEGKSVDGKIVFTRGDVMEVHKLAVERFGALGIITDMMAEFPPVRHRMDLPDARQYISFWWTGFEERRGFGFVLTPKQGDDLRRLIRRLEREGVKGGEVGKVRVYANIEARFYDGKVEDVTAFIAGETDEEVLCVAHLCHPQPSANDNASGCAALLEAARILNKLIGEGKLKKPKRGIRFLLVPEMTGTYAYLANNEDRVGRTVAGLNLDMVGESQELCGSMLYIVETPHAEPSFVNELIGKIVEHMADKGNIPGASSEGFFKYRVVAFSAGSDHYILSDPTVNIPCPSIGSWPDKYYHTSQDTPDKVDPDMLKRISVLAATYLYFIANAGYEEALWLSYEMNLSYERRIARYIQDRFTEVFESIGKAGCGEGRKEAAKQKILQFLEKVKGRLSYEEVRQIEAMKSLKRLLSDADLQSFEKVAEGLLDDVRQITKGAYRRALRKAMDLADALKVSPLPRKRRKRLSNLEKKAKDIFPKRIQKGPLRVGELLPLLTKEQKEKYKELEKKIAGSIAIALNALHAMYWCNGKRSLLEISRMVEMEKGRSDLAFLMEYFNFLNTINLVAIERGRLSG